MTEAGSVGRRTNRRGLATRENILEAALTSLASGQPGSVSANRIAKDVGATWGTVKYQFGDVDGFWAAVLHRTAERRAGLLAAPVEPDTSLRSRVSRIVDTLYHGLSSSDSRAIENLRAALPRNPDELERLYPLTAAELASWERSWLETCQRAFADLDLSPDRVRNVATLIPGAMRGLVSERRLGSYADLDVARETLTMALVAYLASPEDR
ncbi:TetR/AcrR family transcriptional regulator [Mycobacterium hodleri]|uniref:TetR/AcrR family transcriptional regulator n=1 Tax=Mycolicibacterium hodleri TaxID=49897 RepID=UPI0021F284DB|nr:TetR/AcrR family transcriptional regulator [Mycolicibacterium hodleri]MCV7136410.1 TetR/AcrR family transcriptional regulator [Mycolicibacterium hodleri]